MRNRLFGVFVALTLALTGCKSDTERQTVDPVAEKKSTHLHVVDYVTSDPRLEPTLRVGGVFEVRTATGGPVVLQSQVDQQRRAAEEQRRANEEAAARQ